MRGFMLVSREALYQSMNAVTLLCFNSGTRARKRGGAAMARASLEAQVARLSAIEDIKQLKARYCEYCDDQYNPDGVSGLFYVLRDETWMFQQPICRTQFYAAHATGWATQTAG